ncbi:MAG: hypothetical protein KDJ97_37140 [Anaerolineae bacterium]|nr:hypothetical protein [Anaerolineae bacterium]
MTNPTDREVVVVLEHAQHHLFPPTYEMVRESTTLPYCLITAPFGVQGIACLVCESHPISYNTNDIENKYCAYGNHFFDTGITPEQHRRRHVALYQALNELSGDYLTHHPNTNPHTTTVIDLLAWAAQQTRQPTGDARPEQPPDPGDFSNYPGVK